MNVAFAATIRRGSPVSEAFDAASRLGLGLLDLWLAEAGNFEASDWAIAGDAIRSGEADTGVRLVALGGSLGAPIHAGGRATRAAAWRRFLNLLNAAEACGARVVRLRSSPAPASLPFAEALFCAQRLLVPAVEAAHERGLTICLEPAPGSPFDTPSAFIALAEVCPGLKLTYNPALFVVAGVPLIVSGALIPLAGHVRVRDAAPGRGFVAWGEGGVDIGWLMDSLLRYGYGGAIAVEEPALESESDPFASLRRAIAELRGIMEGLTAW